MKEDYITQSYEIEEVNPLPENDCIDTLVDMFSPSAVSGKDLFIDDDEVHHFYVRLADWAWYVVRVDLNNGEDMIALGTAISIHGDLAPSVCYDWTPAGSPELVQPTDDQRHWQTGPTDIRPHDAWLRVSYKRVDGHSNDRQIRIICKRGVRSTRYTQAGLTISTLDDETIARIQAPILKRLERTENLLLDVLRDQQQAKGIYYCEKCHGRVQSNRCITRKDADGVERYWHHECDNLVFEEDP